MFSKLCSQQITCFQVLLSIYRTKSRFSIILNDLKFVFFIIIILSKAENCSRTIAYLKYFQNILRVKVGVLIEYFNLKLSDKGLQTHRQNMLVYIQAMYKYTITYEIMFMNPKFQTEYCACLEECFDQPLRQKVRHAALLERNSSALWR